MRNHQESFHKWFTQSTLKQFYSADLSLYSCIPCNSGGPDDFFAIIIRLRAYLGEPLTISMKRLKQLEGKSRCDQRPSEVTASATC